MPPARALPVALLTATILALFARTFVVQAYRIPTVSMAPGLEPGDHILVNKFIYGVARTGGNHPAWLPARDARRGDVVVFASPREPRRDLVKRCLGLPGESVEMSAGELWIGGDRIDERGYLHPSRSPKSKTAETFGPVTVPGRHYFCLGDHRTRSRDSRSWGPVPARNLLGRAVMIYLSVDDRVAEGQGSWDKIGGLWGWISGLRWERCFRLVR